MSGLSPSMRFNRCNLVLSADLGSTIQGSFKHDATSARRRLMMASVSLKYPFLLSTLLLAVSRADGEFPRIWLTHQTNDPSHVVVNWETAKPAPSVVRYGLTSKLDRAVKDDAAVTLHHVEIDIPEKDVVYHYSVGEGADASPEATFKGYPVKELRVAVVGDWGYAKGKDLSALRKDDVHLLVTAGDNVPSLHESGKEGIKAFRALIDEAPDLFRSTPFMPALGNHDKEAHPRGPKPPAEPVYDVDAKAYREFFALPGDEWKWHFDLTDFDVRFIALDIEHISDFGTTWQTCHAFDENSEQFRWYRETMNQTKSGFVFSIINENQAGLNGRTKGLWHGEFRRGSALISGFGYFAERAELNDGLPYFNTCLKGDGAKYFGPQAQFKASEDNYLLLIFKRGSDEMTVQFKNLRGEVMDTRVIKKRPAR